MEGGNEGNAREGMKGTQGWREGTKGTQG